MANMFKKFVFISLFFIFSLILPELQVNAFASPADCLKNIQQAVDDGDMADFEKLVDLNAILQQSVDVFFEEIRKPDNMALLPPMFALMLSGTADSAGIRQLLLEEARAFVSNGIASGAFAGKKLDYAQKQSLLAPLFANASFGRKEISFAGQPEKTESGWLQPFFVHDYGNDHDYGVIGLFQEENGTLRLKALENLPELFSAILEEAKL